MSMVNDHGLVTSLTEHCPQASSENYWISHNDHYDETHDVAVMATTRLQGGGSL